MAKQVKLKHQNGQVYPQTTTDAVADIKRKKLLSEVLDNLDSTDNLQDAKIKNLEDANGLSIPVRKSMLRLYRQMGSTNTALTSYTNEVRESILNMEEFASLGTGLFIHWGVYSVLAGNYTGERVSTSSVSTASSVTYNTEWIMRVLGIPKDIYKAYETQFTSDNWDAEEIARMASEAGMGYIVITAKHHEGFSLYPTNYGSWDVRTSGARNTILDELKAACDKYNLKFGLYYSQYWDWMAEGGFGLNHGNTWCKTDLYTDAEHTEYCNNAALQIQEMVEKFNPFILWYDPGTSYDSKYVNIFKNAEYTYYPHVITNDRLDYNRNYGDFGTGERTIYLKNKLKYGEACFTMNDTWGYSDNNENKYFSIEILFKQFMLYSLAYGQNCLMNIGPKADGTIPQKQIETLETIKNFVTKYGSFRNYKRVNYKSMPKWGYMLELEGNKLLCYIIQPNNTGYENVVLDNVPVKNLEQVNILTPGTNPISSIRDGKIYISGLALDEETKIGVVELNYSLKPIVDDANKLSADELLPSRTIPMRNGYSYSFGNFIYKIKPSNNQNYITDFIWDDNDGNYSPILNLTLPSLYDEIDTITLTIKDLVTNNSTVITYLNNAIETTDNVALINGRKYELIFNINSSNNKFVDFNGIQFTPEDTSIHVTSVTIDSDNITLTEGDIHTLTATISPDDATNKNVTWSTSDDTIATVNNGVVTAISEGTAIITVETEDGNKTATCSVQVVALDDSVPVTGISLNKTEAEILVGDSEQLIATVYPDNATNKNVIWTSSNGSAVYCDSTGGLFICGEGESIITVTTEDGNFSATCTVTASPVICTEVVLEETEVTLLPGRTYEAVYDLLPHTPSCPTHPLVYFTSSNEEIASVSPEGIITALSPGVVTITYTSEDGPSTELTVTVEPEVYDYVYERNYMVGDATDGDEPGFKLFSDELTNWTLFGYAKTSANSAQKDNNATLYQCVVDSSPWTGLRQDADNNNYPISGSTNSPLIPRLLAGGDNYINTNTGSVSTSKPRISFDEVIHPVCISRDGDTFKYTINGEDWVTFTNLTSTQLARLKNAVLTVGFDYKRSGGQITDTKYRKLLTVDPCCVAIKWESEYNFYSLYQKYDESRQVPITNIHVDNITLSPGETKAITYTLEPANASQPINCTQIGTYDIIKVDSVNNTVTYMGEGTESIFVMPYGSSNYNYRGIVTCLPESTDMTLDSSKLDESTLG